MLELTSGHSHVESHEVLAWHLNAMKLPLRLMRYEEAAAASTSVSTVTTTTVAPVTTTTAAPVTTTTEAPQPVVVAAAPVATTTTVAPASPTTAATHSERGQATWYSQAPPGKCASPTLAFGTVLTVTNDANGRSTTCTVDDREADGYPRVVDLSYSGFSQIADPSQGVVDVTISW